MHICYKDKEVKDAIENGDTEIAIKIIDNTSNAILGSYTMGWIGAVASQQKNTTPGMQAILQDNGYKYKETKGILFQGEVMIYELKDAKKKENLSNFENITIGPELAQNINCKDCLHYKDNKCEIYEVAPLTGDVDDYCGDFRKLI